MSENRDPERERIVMAAVRELVDAPSGERQARLDELSRGDDRLRAEVQELLAGYDPEDDFLETPASDPRTAEWRLAEEQLGREIGPYRLDRVLGVGGMGVVYHARRVDGQIEMEVAIKLVKPGAGLHGQELARRLRRERQILANLRHPNIARLLDGGATEDGQPYVIMEYVPGEPITTFCAEHHLGLRERLRLFHTVCLAVDHAHGQKIVHRDLKPSNILVGPDRSPLLLDFGIAALAAGTPRAQAPWLTQTQGRLRLFTPANASPEQWRGEPITPATDVYGLGLILYELLTGRSAYAFTSDQPEELERIICETVPAPPSLAAVPTPETDGLDGDLDAIVLTALHKIPSLRYPSARALADDIERRLADQPVAAARTPAAASDPLHDTAAYKLDPPELGRQDNDGSRIGVAAFLGRHQWGVGAGGLVGMLAAVGMLLLILPPPPPPPTPTPALTAKVAPTPATVPTITATVASSMATSIAPAPMFALRAAPARIDLGRDQPEQQIALTASGADQLAWEVVRDPLVPWVEIQPANGVIQPGDQQWLKVKVDRGQAPPGDFQSVLAIRSRVQGADITAMVDVRGSVAPRLRLAAPVASLEFGREDLSREVALVLDGPGEAAWTATVTGEGFSVDTPNGTIRSGDQKPLTVRVDRTKFPRSGAAGTGSDAEAPIKGKLTIIGQGGQTINLDLTGLRAASVTPVPNPTASGCGEGDPEPIVMLEKPRVGRGEPARLTIVEKGKRGESPATFQWYFEEAPSWLELEIDGQRKEPDPGGQDETKRVKTESGGTKLSIVPDWSQLGPVPRQGNIIIMVSSKRRYVTIDAFYNISTGEVELAVRYPSPPSTAAGCL